MLELWIKPLLQFNRKLIKIEVIKRGNNEMRKERQTLRAWTAQQHPELDPESRVFELVMGMELFNTMLPPDIEVPKPKRPKYDPADMMDDFREIRQDRFEQANDHDDCDSADCGVHVR